MSEGLGWLPVEAREDLEEEQARASGAERDRLLALDDRARVLALLDRVAAGSGARLVAEDLRAVIESFGGITAVDQAALAVRFPGLVAE